MPGLQRCDYPDSPEAYVAPWHRTDDKTLKLTISELALFLEGSKVLFSGKQVSPEAFFPQQIRSKQMSDG